MAESGQQQNAVIMGALLHDIGKVIQRANEGYERHSKLGYEFVKELLDPDGNDSILDCIRYHHNDELQNEGKNLPDNSPAHIVCEADNISSGMDRQGIRKFYKKSFAKDMALNSIFPLLSEMGKETDKIQNYGDISKFSHYLRHISDEEINFPVKKARTSGDKYENIVEPLRGILKSAKSPNSLLIHLERLTSFIPSSTNNNEIPDISLFDHLKTTSAIAGAMFQHFNETGQDNYRKACSDKKRNERFFLMVSADMSGVQDFIYTVPSKGALKTLRARSFYLDMAMEHTADEILEALGLSRANLLYSGGGHFYMLLPNTDRAKVILERVHSGINDWFLKKYGTALYMAMAWEECSSNDLRGEKNKNGESRTTADLFRILSGKLSEEKQRRYSFDQLSRILDPTDQLNKVRGDSRECRVCKQSSSNLSEYNIEEEGGEEGELICPICKSFVILGRELSGRKVFIITLEKPSGDYIEMPSWKEEKRYLHTIPALRAEETLKSSDYLRIYVRDTSDTLLPATAQIRMGDYVPDNQDGSTASFQDFAENSQGIKRIAVLRADVDDLSRAFTSGFPKTMRWKGENNAEINVQTISRYATLSRQLSLFFKHYINLICRGNLKGSSSLKQDEKDMIKPFKLLSHQIGTDGEKKNIAIIYSGGDDLFIAGAWNEIVELAVDLRRAFEKYTTNRLSFSAGIGFFNPAFPIYQMANLTGKLEDKAKKHSFNGKEKDSIALFGIEKRIGKDGNPVELSHVYNWSEFIGERDDENTVIGKFRFLESNFDMGHKTANRKPALSKALLYRLLSIIEDGIITDRMNLARLAYTLARLEERIKENDGNNHTDVVRELKNKIYRWAGDKRERKQLLTALNLIVYIYREKNKKDEGGR